MPVATWYVRIVSTPGSSIARRENINIRIIMRFMGVLHIYWPLGPFTYQDNIRGWGSSFFPRFKKPAFWYGSHGGRGVFLGRYLICIKPLVSGKAG